MPLFTGLINAPITPLNEDGTLNEASYRRIINWQLEAGLHGMFLCGGGGEGVFLPVEVRKAAAAAGVDEIGDRGHKIVHVGALSLRDTIELAQHAQKCGADAVGSLPPFTFATDDETIVQFFKGLVEAVDIPVFAYHLPPVTHVNIFTDLMRKLVEDAGVTGIKFTDHNIFEAQRLMKVTDGNLLYGRDEQIVAALFMGAPGGIGSTYNVMPNLYGDLWKQFQAGEYDAAQKSQRTINRIIEVILNYGGVGSLKAMLNLLGFDAGAPVMPNRTLPPNRVASLKADLDAIGYFDLVKT